MRSKRTCEQYLRDSQAWADHIASHLNGVVYEDFLESILLQDAVAKCVEKIGETAKQALKLDPALQSNYPDFKVDRAYAARNIIAHGYFDIVWDTAQYSVPAMALVVRRILQDRAKDQQT